MPRDTIDRIHLIRHGRSAHGHRGWLSADGFRNWRESYEKAGIVDDPPLELRRKVDAAGIVVSSDATRAIESARRLCSGQFAISAMLREMELAAPAIIPVVLPLSGWALMVGLRAALLRLRGQYPPATELSRVESAARWLIELAEDHGEVVVITHASFRAELARSLSGAGWSRRNGARSLRYWSCWTFETSPARRDHSPATASAAGLLVRSSRPGH